MGRPLASGVGRRGRMPGVSEGGIRNIPSKPADAQAILQFSRQFLTEFRSVMRSDPGAYVCRYWKPAEHVRGPDQDRGPDEVLILNQPLLRRLVANSYQDHERPGVGRARARTQKHRTGFGSVGRAGRLWGDEGRDVRALRASRPRSSGRTSVSWRRSLRAGGGRADQMDRPV